VPSCAKFAFDGIACVVSNPVTSTFSALGGIRNPNLLIRSRAQRVDRRRYKSLTCGNTRL
jgi:hypothetical protein